MEQMSKLIRIYKPRKARFIGLAAAGSVIAAVGLFVITPQTSDNTELNEQFVALHTKERGALVFDQWQKTDLPVQIRYVDKSAMRDPYFSKNMAAYLKPFSDFKILLLAKNHIKIDNQTINFDSTCELEIGGWIDNIYLKDSNGKEKFCIHSSTVLSADIFTALLSAQIK